MCKKSLYTSKQAVYSLALKVTSAELLHKLFIARIFYKNDKNTINFAWSLQKFGNYYNLIF